MKEAKAKARELKKASKMAFKEQHKRHAAMNTGPQVRIRAL